MSARMFDAIALWTTTGGGRLMYLGGNGFSMNVNFDAERPWIMENRRVELWERGEEFQRSEAFNSTDGRRADTSPRRAVSPRRSPASSPRPWASITRIRTC